MNTNENTKLMCMIEKCENTIDNLHIILENYDNILNPTLERKSFFESLIKHYYDLSEIIEKIHQEVQSDLEDPKIYWMYVKKEQLRLDFADTVNFYSSELFPSIEVRTFFMELRDIYQELTKHDQDVYRFVFTDSDDDSEVA